MVAYLEQRSDATSPRARGPNPDLSLDAPSNPRVVCLRSRPCPPTDNLGLDDLFGRLIPPFIAYAATRKWEHVSAIVVLAQQQQVDVGFWFSICRKLSDPLVARCQTKVPQEGRISENR